MILTISSLLMMFANLMQQTKKIIQEKYLKNDNGNTTSTNAMEATNEQINEKTQEIKDQIYGYYFISIFYFFFILCDNFIKKLLFKN